MGQLDEAIKAHLELKRKHGASEEELQAEEQEALGPVRREAASEQTDEPEPDAVVEAELDAEDELDVEEEPVLEEAPALEEEPVLEEEPLEEEPAFAPSYPPEEPPEDFAPDAFDEPADLTEPLPPAGREAAFDPLDPLAPAQPDPEPAAGATPPRGFDAVREPGPDEEEDVLEETPDFLQETPEHDRLWFEQKPPRDFDFDE